MKIPALDPRDYQAEALSALDNGVKLAVWCWSRRGGKDYTAFSYGVKKMVERPMNVVIIWPTKKQGYDNFWTAVDNDGKPILDAIPRSLIAQQTNSSTDMHVTLKNGSTLSLLGATDPDALRGANAKLYIFSEFVDVDSAVYDIIKPVVAVNGGQIIIQSTPKIDGISGGTFKKLFDRALRNWTEGAKTQFASLITADRYLSKEVLEELRQECIEKNGNDFMWRQEYMCDFGQASATSYYGAALKVNRKAGLLGLFPYEKAYPVFTAWDLGTSDSTAITFFQIINKRVRFIDYYEVHDIGYQPIVNFLRTKPYTYGHHFIPHDGAVREASDATQRIDKLIALGLTNISLLTRENKEDGIREAVDGIKLAEINEPTTKQLLEKLILYKRKYNGITGDYEGPEHKTESHAADSVRYAFTAIRQFFDELTLDFLYGDEMAEETYESDSYAAPAGFQQPAYY